MQINNRFQTNKKGKKIAIIHDALVVSGGAERFTIALSEAFPEAELYTSVYLPNGTFEYFRTKKIHTLPGSKYIFNEKQFKRLLPLWIWGFRHLDLSSFDLIISSSTYAAKYIKVPPKTKHFCYLHAPLRYIWERSSYSYQNLPFSSRIIHLLDLFIPILRRVDLYYTKKIDFLIANSENMAKKILQVYGRVPQVIYPPIYLSDYQLASVREDYFLFVGRLLRYKRVDLAMKACEILNCKLLIVGEGPEKGDLQRLAGKQIKLLGKVSENDLKILYSNAKGLIVPGCEDFGLVPLEAQASGCPVIAFKGGGALETVADGKTGLFFDQQEVDSLVEALRKFEMIEFNGKEIREFVSRFDIANFIAEIQKFVMENS